MDKDKLYEMISAILAVCITAKSKDSKDDDFLIGAIDVIGRLITNSIDTEILESCLAKFDTGEKLTNYLDESWNKQMGLANNFKE